MYLNSLHYEENQENQLNKIYILSTSKVWNSIIQFNILNMLIENSIAEI